MRHRKLLIYSIFMLVSLTAYSQESKKQQPMKFNKLSLAEENVILNKGTERPWTGAHLNNKTEGTYTCKRCDAALYKASDKFNSNCGWPSFDDQITGAVKHIPDADGSRTEIVCANCGGHLGHVFSGEGFTEKNTRHCVNSISLNFTAKQTTATEKVHFAAGCFWGVEYYLKRKSGVLKTTVGYAGGQTKNPTYKDICYTNTGHAEVVEVEYDPSIISYEELAKLFFEIHDPCQIDRQGPDVGQQYRSAVYYFTETQRETTLKLIGILEQKGFKIATEVKKASTFWEGEEYHQEYYDKKGGVPYCHGYTKRF